MRGECLASPSAVRDQSTDMQLEHTEAIEKRLWIAADTLRANSLYASNEYFLPVMGLVFLRHAYSRYLTVKEELAARMPTRGGRRRALGKQDFSQQSAIFLRPKAQFDHLVSPARRRRPRRSDHRGHGVDRSGLRQPARHAL